MSITAGGSYNSTKTGTYVVEGCENRAEIRYQSIAACAHGAVEGHEQKGGDE